MKRGSSVTLVAYTEDGPIAGGKRMRETMADEGCGFETCSYDFAGVVLKSGRF